MTANFGTDGKFRLLAPLKFKLTSIKEQVRFAATDVAMEVTPQVARQTDFGRTTDIYQKVNGVDLSVGLGNYAK